MISGLIEIANSAVVALSALSGAAIGAGASTWSIRQNAINQWNKEAHKDLRNFLRSTALAVNNKYLALNAVSAHLRTNLSATRRRTKDPNGNGKGKQPLTHNNIPLISKELLDSDASTTAALRETLVESIIYGGNITYELLEEFDRLRSEITESIQTHDVDQADLRLQQMGLLLPAIYTAIQRDLKEIDLLIARNLQPWKGRRRLVTEINTILRKLEENEKSKTNEYLKHRGPDSAGFNFMKDEKD
ncbi:hypothetical protein ACH0BO_11355 [Brevibacterium luteolum]|uniref:hypothetical protein n=1 Tax=Brevibacterium luteolum TaxID=199591 RepID=UPI003879CDA2